jgi:hypothetical protein
VVANVLLLHQGQEFRDEKCSNSSVKNEQILKSDKKWRPYSYSGRSSLDDGSGCPMSSEENESLETTDSVLLMSANDDIVPDLSERIYMVCCRVEIAQILHCRRCERIYYSYQGTGCP